MLRSASYGSYGSAGSSRRYVGLSWVVGLHALLLALIVSGVFQTTVNHLLKKPLEAVVLQEVIVPPPPAPPVPLPKPQLDQPKPSTPAVERTVQPAPALVSSPAPSESPVHAAPEPAAAPTNNTPVVHAAPAPPPAEAPHKSTASAEAEYAARLKALLNANKRYPTGRQASQQRPQGVVKLWFTLNRAGVLLEAGVLEAADSNLLNDAALSTVRRSSYPPFAAELWPGQEQHKFTVDIDFLPPG